MNYYFAPFVPGLKTHITLVNYPPVGGPPASAADVNVYATWPEDKVWRIVEMDGLAQGSTVSIAHSDIPVDYPEDRMIAYFMYPRKLPEQLDTLPLEPEIRSAPAWRGNIQFRSDTTAVSYQGEIPGEMLKIPKGSLSSICPMVQDGLGISTTFIFSNLRAVPTIEKRSLILARMRTRKVVSIQDVYTNTCNVIDLGDSASDLSDPLCAFSPDMAGVPLYLNHDREFSQMSLEHSHPPEELTAYGTTEDRRAIVGKMKSYWLSEVANTQGNAGGADS